MCSSEWDEFLKAYNEKKKLEEYQEHRVLPRPKTTKLSVFLYGVLLFALLGVGCLPFTVCAFDPLLKIALSVAYIAAMIEAYGRFFCNKARRMLSALCKGRNTQKMQMYSVLL